MPLELAERYMKSFFGQASLEAMREILADDLMFEGPFFKANSAKEYLDRLTEDPPQDVSYELEQVYADEKSACLIYVFSKPGVNTRMVQTFEVADDKIRNIKLVFDTGAFG